MAGTRGTNARQRRLQETRASRDRQWLLIGVTAVLGLAAVVVVVGLIWAWYLPPRAHVLRVGSADFSAQDIVNRARYLAAAGNGDAVRTPAEEAIESLTREGILLELGQPLVAEVTDRDVRDAIAQRLGLTDSAVIPVLGATETPTPEPAAEPGATPAYSDEAFGDAYADFLRVAPIQRDDFERIIRAGLVEERLTEQFKTEVPASGDQMRLDVVQTSDRTLAQALVDAVAGGEDFEEAAIRLGIVTSDEGVVDVGWLAPETISERIRDAIVPLQAGQTSGVLDDSINVGFEVYFVAERSTTAPYQEAVIEQLATKRLNEFLDAQEAAAGVVEVDLSGGERDWIAERAQRLIAEDRASG